MNKQMILDMLDQSYSNTERVLRKLNAENIHFRLNPKTGSAGFIVRHIGESMHLLTTFLGVSTEVKNTTMGFIDEGQGLALEESRKMVENGYEILRTYAIEATEESWAEMIETPFFGSVSRLRLFSHILFHNSYHIGQIALSLAKGA
jgi:uncharacterized damage-inducible protein DinB